MKIAVISNNNTAVENIYEKMKEKNYDFFIAYLGNSDNVERFFSYKDNLEEIKKRCKCKTDKMNVYEIVEKINKLFEYSNEMENLKIKLYEINQEFKHYKELHKFNNKYDNIIDFESIDKCLSLKFYLISLKKISIFNKFKLKKKYNLKSINTDDIEGILLYLDYRIYYLKIKTLENRIKEINVFLEENKLSDLNFTLVNKSQEIFETYLHEKYKDMKRCTLNKDNYKNNFKLFTDRYPVILSTTHSLLRNISYGFNFDLIIIDEASQSDILTSLLTMNVASQMVIVGDQKQLSQIENQDIYDASIKLAELYNIKKHFQYKDNSILQSVLNLPCKIENTILREHYRCDSRIIQFCNKKFYDNELIICTDTSKTDPLFIIHTVPRNHSRPNPNGKGQYNDREAQEIIEILRNCGNDSVGIITPFRAQADYIKSLIIDKYANVEVDRIHKYQGRQKNIIILSTVVNDLNYEKDSFITDFVTNDKLLNVAISRSIKKLYLVVSDKVYKSNNTIAQFIDYIKYNCTNESSKEGIVTSIFDVLYDGQYKAMLRSPCRKFVDSVAEEIAFKYINHVLKDYPDYRLHLHYKLSDLISNYNGFSKEEIDI